MGGVSHGNDTHRESDEAAGERPLRGVREQTPDFYDHDGPGGKPTGVDGDEQMMLAMYKSMPDLHVTVEDMIAERDKVMCRNTWRWTDPVSRQKMRFHGFVL